ncbi:hypothetical protein MTR_2g069920 [Medicago truncatula]|uniref:Uncharacterized protein n=1 Tax=Medicago truncatula TaxID=3880 RepID=A0A072V8Q1_MEDTR|nr:hypothetical protein MTR_2g069920 [Medicago truncatula]
MEVGFSFPSQSNLFQDICLAVRLCIALMENYGLDKITLESSTTKHIDPEMVWNLQDCIAYDSSYEMKVQYDGMWDDESKIEDELHILTVLHLLLISCITFSN